jgi:hypothetical protein
VQGDPLVLGLREPPADLGVLVGAVVIQYDVQVNGRMGGGDLLQEAQEFLVAVPRVEASAVIFPVATSRAANRVVVPLRL